MSAASLSFKTPLDGGKELVKLRQAGSEEGRGRAQGGDGEGSACQRSQTG